ncbi:uncharacterized protein LOC135385864 [Ornithodoros turicata]|uniref:uncharacterized protein LOC135385864 n=1 Tax=Ornithodoros turicata TaxID=34597 RepID=UPI00313879F7
MPLKTRSSHLRRLNLNQELSYLRKNMCYATPYAYYAYYKNYVQDRDDSCFVERQLCQPKNKVAKFNYAFRGADGQIVTRYNQDYFLKSSPGYNVSNVQYYPHPNGAYSPFPVLYMKCGNCVIYNDLQLRYDTCHFLVVDPDNIDPCCLEMYDYLCGPTKISLYDKCNCADVYAAVQSTY